MDPRVRRRPSRANVLQVIVPPTDSRSAEAVAIVTGGSYGIGRELARELAGRGYAVVVVYLQDQSEAEAVVEGVLAANGTALAVRADVRDELDVERLFDETLAAYGRIDVVVHAADEDEVVVDRQAALRLRDGVAIVKTDHDVAALLASLDHRRSGPGA